MKTINVKIFHPTNNSNIDICLPENILLRDVFSHLIDTNFLSAGQSYAGLLIPRGMLDNDKSISENGVGNNDTIRLFSDSLL
jgi:hypothetical protein